MSFMCIITAIISYPPLSFPLPDKLQAIQAVQTLLGAWFNPNSQWTKQVRFCLTDSKIMESEESDGNLVGGH